MTQHSEARGPAHWAVEVGVALTTLAFGMAVVTGSLRVGINWGVEGPRAGFFPFYIGMFIILASVINLAAVFLRGRGDRRFAEWSQLRRVVSVVVPTTLYVAFIPYIGIYVSSALLLAVFMRWLGRYPWSRILPIAIGVPMLLYFMFERWFLIPLPKGPVEDLLRF